MTDIRREKEARAAAQALRDAAIRFLDATAPKAREDDDEAEDLALLARAELENSGHPMIPSAIAERLFAGDNPVKALREWRGITQEKLANTIDISQAFLSEIEIGNKTAAAIVYQRIASVLGVGVDLLLPDEELPVFQLTPQSLADPDWEASTYKGTVIVRAPSEKAARWAASLAFNIATQRKHIGERTRINPWRQVDLVEAKTVRDVTWSGQGGIEILDPPHHNEWLGGIDFKNL